jgi:hypothetical protein
MEIELLSNTFTVEHNGIEFIFNRDKRTLLEVAIKGYDVGILSDRMKADLVSIKNAVTKDGKALEPKDFGLFPIDIYTSVFALYFEQIKLQLQNKSKELADTAIKKKNAKK